MRKRKIGLLIGASLLLAGAGVTTAITTTSCSKAEKSGLTFSNWKLDKDEFLVKGTGEDMFHMLTVTGDVDGLTSEWDGCVLFTLTSGDRPSDDNMWNPETGKGMNGLMIGLTPNGNNGTKQMEGEISVNLNDIDNEGKFTIDNVWSAKLKEDGDGDYALSTPYKEGDLTFDYGVPNFDNVRGTFERLANNQNDSAVYNVKEIQMEANILTEGAILNLATSVPNTGTNQIDSPTTTNMWDIDKEVQGISYTGPEEQLNGAKAEAESADETPVTIHDVWGRITNESDQISRWFYIGDVSLSKRSA